jgi:hypothetical protein
MRIVFAAAVAAAVSWFSAQVEAADTKPASAPAQASSAPIVFFDIAGPDAPKLRTFYSTMFGWKIDANNAIKTTPLDGTLRQDPAEKIIYIGVPDINRKLDQIKAAGGTVDTPRTVVPKVVIFALFRDPAGNRMGLVETPH